jgi:geranylgeranylglycerol-phosphate geranylgeranyltransferase
MRLYYAFITGISGWIGVAFYHFLFPERTDIWRTALILALLFLSWGINQIINDYLGLPEDRLNAPNRPMVTGALPAKPALFVTALALLVTLAIACALSPLSAIPLLAGVLLNIVYEYAKACSLAGNVVFGLMITMCPIFGFLASGPAPDPLFTSNRISVLALVFMINGVMTYYTYFKDYEGDRAAGKITFVVKYGLQKARYAALAAALFTLGLCLALISFQALPAGDIICKQDFLFVGLTAVLLQGWTGILYFKYPKGPEAYYNLVANFRACAAANCALIALFDGRTALYLLISSYILIGFFFNFYRDARA